MDLCPALLAQARTRAQHWPSTQIIEADVTHYRPLDARLEILYEGEQLASVPYLPGLKVPYYLFLGRKPA